MTVTPLRDKIPAATRRESRYAALGWLWNHSRVTRVRACRLVAQDADAGITLRRWENGSAGWVGVQSCGSTWACPVCSEKIAGQRQAEIAAALAMARSKGLVVAFLTFTVRHKSRHSLRNVWDNVADAWRGATSGNARRWNADRDRFGLVGYLRLWEVTVGRNGWHVHAHALAFLDPAGRTVTARAQIPIARSFFIGPLRKGEELPPLIGPLLEHQVRPEPRSKSQRMPRVRHLQGPDGKWTYRRQLGPLPAATLVPDERQYSLSPAEVTHVVPCAVAIENHAADRDRGRDVGTGIYLRDVQALAASMFERWCNALPAGMVPDDEHGFDARIVTNDDFLADYFVKNTYSIKSTDSAAFEVTGSWAKTAKRGNRTPFGILADIVDGSAGPADVDLWHEWEAVSKGRRQLRWSEGMRELLELDPEVTDEDLADEPDGEGTALDFVSVESRDYRRLAFAGVLPWSLEMTETYSYDLLEQLLEAHGVAFESRGLVCTDLPVRRVRT